jgi:hypothetical protein
MGSGGAMYLRPSLFANRVSQENRIDFLSIYGNDGLMVGARTLPIDHNALANL